MAVNRVRAEKTRGSKGVAPIRPVEAVIPREEPSLQTHASALEFEEESRRDVPAVEEALFEETVLVHFRFLHNMALKITRNEDDAQDLVQETILRAYRFFHKYEAGTNCRAWLYRIMKNTFINGYRKQRRQPSGAPYDELEEILETESDAPAAQTDPQASLINRRLQEDVARALATLPPDYRTALSLSLVEGFSYKEIAETMHCPIGTVMSRIHRGRLLMQKQLRHHAEECEWWGRTGAAPA